MRVISEGPIKITKATVDAAWRRRTTGERLVVRDKDCRGLALIVNPTGMTWTYVYRPRGKDPRTGSRWGNKTITMGNPATHSVEDARIQANIIKGQAAAGADPAAERKAKAAVDQRKRSASLKRLLDDYSDALPRRPKMRGSGPPSLEYVAAEIAQVRLALSAMAAEEMPVADLGDKELRALLSISQGVTTARKRFGALSRFLDWCQDAGHISTNPCVLIGRSRRPKAPQARSHYLQLIDLARLWTAAGKLREPVWRDLVQFLIAVPCRRGEARRLDWAHLKVAAAEWHQLSSMTKNRDPHRLHLHALALKILESRQLAHAKALADGEVDKAARILAAGPPRAGLVFPAPKSGGPVDTFTDIKAALVRASKPERNFEEDDELTGWTWHDFRRSFATALGEAGIPEAVADAILNHRQSATRGGVLGVYQRASRWPEQVKAMELWGRLLQSALDGSEAGAKVITMPRAG